MRTGNHTKIAVFDFNDDGAIKLRPIVDLTSPKMGYDQVRLALLFVE